MVKLFTSGPVWHEVWPVGWGRYRVYQCDAGFAGGLMPGRYVVATVFGRARAEKRARRAQHRYDNPPPPPAPLFSTKPKPGGEAACEALEKKVLDLRGES